MNTFLLIAISLAFGALAWFMLWLSDLVLGDKSTTTNRPRRADPVGSTAAQRRKADEAGRINPSAFVVSSPQGHFLSKAIARSVSDGISRNRVRNRTL
jgi:hypothetical protein